MRATMVCRSCGQAVEIGDDHTGSTVTCPNCAAIHAVPADGRITATTSTEFRSQAAASDDDRDEESYEIEPDERFDRATSEDDEKIPSIALPDVEPVERVWEANLSLRTRLCAFVAYEIGLLILSVVLFMTEDWTVPQFLAAGAIFSALAAFVLGTYDRVEVRRNQRGKVTLSKTWRTCFIPCPPIKIPLRQYESLATSADPEHSLPDWIVLVWLLSLGMLPGVLWWIFVFSKPAFRVALTRDHGHPALILYQGRNEEQTYDIARTISDVCRYRWRKAF